MTTETPAVDAELEAAVSAFFRDHATAEVVAAGDGAGMPRELWSAVHGLDLTYVGVPEGAAGSGGSLLDACTVLRVAAAQAAPLPLLEAHLAGWLLSLAGLEVPKGGLCPTVAFADPERVAIEGGVVRGVLDDVPFGADADLVVVVSEDDGGLAQVSVVHPRREAVRSGVDLAGQDRSRIELDGSETRSTAGIGVAMRAVELRACLLRAAQIAGALGAVSALTLDFTRQREQFGRPIASFQAVQAHLVTLAQSAITVAVSVDRAATAAAHGPAAFEICAAKLAANGAARDAAAAAHQAHGALGLTQEYRLHQLTRRLHAWRLDHGTDSRLAGQIAAMLDGRASLMVGVLDDEIAEVAR